MRIVVLPIDSRPCNTQFIQSLVQWGGGECVLPAPEELDDFRRPASLDDSRAFLERELPRADAAVLSLDHWCFGSLLASRETLVQESEALRRVQSLRSLLRRFPGLPVFLSSVILRSSLSTLCRDDLPAYEAMTAYSIHSDRFARYGLPEDAEAAQRAKEQIAPALLEKVLAVRRRNLAVNLAAVDMAAEGIITSLSVLQEDTQQEGIPRQDQEAILHHMTEKRITNVFLRNGTDEAGALHAALALRAGQPPLGVHVRYLGQADFTAPYEDRPFRRNLENAMAELGLFQEESSEIVLLVCCPEHGEQAEADVPAAERFLRRIAAEADALIAAGRKVYLLDIIRANGGVYPLPGMISGINELWGYSAWNTASNSLGTLLAQIATDQLRGERNLRFLQERLLDDWLYQGRLRPRLEALLERENEDIYCLTGKASAEAMLRGLYQRELPGCWPLGEVPDWKVSLPWRRTFEVKVSAR